jgi:hypothetical protein
VCVAQTSAETFGKTNLCSETEGNLDNAILIYRQILNPAPLQREIAAQAQYRLVQALLQEAGIRFQEEKNSVSMQSHACGRCLRQLLLP